MKITGGLLALIITAISWVIWQKRQAQARVRLRELDEGTRCIACDGTDLDRTGGVARCLRCGHKISLAVLQAALVSESELASVTKPADETLLR